MKISMITQKLGIDFGPYIVYAVCVADNALSITPLLVDLEQAGRILGLKKSSVRALIAREELPAVRADRGGKFFVPRAALEKFAARLR